LLARKVTAILASLRDNCFYCLLPPSKIMTAAPDPTSKPKTAAAKHTDDVSAPVRPNPPATPVGKASSPTAAKAALEPPMDEELVSRLQPISPPSERLQYRAIGLIRGSYRPSDQGFNRGILVTDEGVELDAVLLGQVMSLVKKHLDLEKEHLWVVYPRTREKQKSLHVQIVGVWEPEQLQPGLSAQNSYGDGYFSVRGEVLFQNEDKQYLVVRIQQSARKGSSPGKAFKLRLEGAVEMRSPGFFWEFDVQRQESQLLISKANPIGVLPPKKGSKKAGDDKSRVRRSRGPSRPGATMDGRSDGARDYNRFSPREREEGASVSEQRKPFTKPVKRSAERPSES
jgi:hypothetical protein